MRKEELALPFITLLGASLRLINLLDFHGLESDEAIYTQTIFALTKGLIPYKDVYIAHPPVYFYISYPIILADSSLGLIRFFNVVLSLGTLCMIFKICKLAYSRRVAIVSSLIYAIFPFGIYESRLVLIENGLSLLISISVFFLTKFVVKNDPKYMFFSGLFAGISCMTKYTGASVSMAILAFILIRARKLKPISLFISGFLLVPVGILIWLLSSNIWPIFYTQTVYWQLIRIGQSMSDRIYFLIASLGVGIVVLMLFAMPMVFIGMGNPNDELVMLVLFIPLFSILVSKQIFPQYFIILLIPLCILAARTIDQYQMYIHTRSYIQNSWKKVMVFAIIAIIIEGVLFGYMSSKYGVDSQIAASIFVNDQEKALLEAQIAAGNYIKKYTVPTDKIWTTDAAIAYFSQRVIVTTDSKYWKYQGFFIDIWGYQPSAIFQFSSGSYRSFIDIWGYGPTKFDYAGPIKDYPNGTITLSDLRLALENEKPKIIVMVNASQEDYLIWNGIHNPYHSENGLCDFIEGHYHLATDREGQILASQGIEFWMLYDKPTI